MENLKEETVELKPDEETKKDLDSELELDNETEITIDEEPEQKVEIISEDEPISDSEASEIKVEEANTTNCLALTIKEDHKLVAVKNVFLTSVRMSWKVIVSSITLALIRLFS